jgi:hypothetical protein
VHETKVKNKRRLVYAHPFDEILASTVTLLQLQRDGRNRTQVSLQTEMLVEGVQ